MKEKNAAEVIRKTAERWPATFVARSAFRQFSGGLFSPGTMANHDSAGTGPKGAFKVGRQQAYPVDSSVEWLIARVQP
ncbi:MAG: hypothetical protein KQH59_15355 [Desulfobulbaceae bacterium]|nr:hypothetical protein [Desulfobulbaceae bacterium]